MRKSNLVWLQTNSCISSPLSQPSSSWYLLYIGLGSCQEEGGGLGWSQKLLKTPILAFILIYSCLHLLAPTGALIVIDFKHCCQYLQLLATDDNFWQLMATFASLKKYGTASCGSCEKCQLVVGVR